MVSKRLEGAARLERFTLLFPLCTRLAAALVLLMLGMGLEQVGCCPGGTSSNVVALTARADVAPLGGDDHAEHPGGPAATTPAGVTT